MQRKRKLFLLQVVCLALFSVSVLIMPMMGKLWMNSKSNTAMIFNGALFWLSLIALMCSIIRFNNQRKRSSFTTKKVEGYRQLGLIHFGQNKVAMASDVAMCVSLIAFIILSIWASQLQILIFLMLAMFMFSFGMHCMYNGSGYIYAYQYDSSKNTKGKRR